MGDSTALLAILGGGGGFATVFWKYIQTDKQVSVLEARMNEHDKAYQEVKGDIAAIRNDIKAGFDRLQDKIDQLKP